jgi:hypothetical protein
MTTPREDPQMELWLNGEAPDDVGRVLDDLLLDGPGQQKTRSAVRSLRRRLSSSKSEVAYIGRLSDPTVGSLMVARTERGLVAVAFTDREDEFKYQLERGGYRVAESPSQVDQETRSSASIWMRNGPALICKWILVVLRHSSARC